MTPDEVTAAASVASFVVFAASALAALTQLRHMRASNQIEAVLSLAREFRSPEVQGALCYVQDELPAKLQDPAYRERLARVGYIDPREHPELVVCNYFNEIGTLLEHKFVSEAAILDLSGRLVVYYWKKLEPVIAIMRRERGDLQYRDFERLATRAHRWIAQKSKADVSHRAQRRSIADPWRDADRSPRPEDSTASPDAPAPVTQQVH